MKKNTLAVIVFALFLAAISGCGDCARPKAPSGNFPAAVNTVDNKSAGQQYAVPADMVKPCDGCVPGIKKQVEKIEEAAKGIKPQKKELAKEGENLYFLDIYKSGGRIIKLVKRSGGEMGFEKCYYYFNEKRQLIAFELRKRWFDMDPKTSHLIHDNGEIKGPGEIYYFENALLVGVENKSTILKPGELFRVYVEGENLEKMY